MLQLTHIYASLPSGNMFHRIKSAVLAKDGKGSTPVLEDITLWIGRGESWALLGSEGSGKTTLLRLIAKHIPPDRGLYSADGTIAAAIHEEDGLFKTETGEGNAKIALAEAATSEEPRMQEVRRLFANDALLAKQLHTYMPADRAKLSLCIALAAGPDVLVISNQLEYCEKPFQQQCVFELRKRVRDGMTLLLECGDPALVSRLCESALWLRDKKIRRLGPLEDVQAAISLQQAHKGVAQAWLKNQQVAFSAPLNSVKKDRPREDELYVQRLHEQLQAYAEANLAYEEENAALQDELLKSRVHLQTANTQLTRVLDAFAKTLEVMHAQFRLLKGKEEKSWPRKPKGS